MCFNVSLQIVSFLLFMVQRLTPTTETKMKARSKPNNFPAAA